VGGQHQAVSPHHHPPPVHHQQQLQDGAALDVKTPSEDSGVDVANQWGTRYRFSFAPVRSGRSEIDPGRSIWHFFIIICFFAALID
jgi:hypothetical protein